MTEATIQAHGPKITNPVAQTQAAYVDTRLQTSIDSIKAQALGAMANKIIVGDKTLAELMQTYAAQVMTTTGIKNPAMLSAKILETILSKTPKILQAINSLSENDIKTIRELATKSTLNLSDILISGTREKLVAQLLPLRGASSRAETLPKAQALEINKTLDLNNVPARKLAVTFVGDTEDAITFAAKVIGISGEITRNAIGELAVLNG